MHVDHTYYRRDLNLKVPTISPLSYYGGDTPTSTKRMTFKMHNVHSQLQQRSDTPVRAQQTPLL